MVVHFQEHLIWLFERRLIQELGVVPGGSRLWKELGYSSILSPMFRAWAKGGKSYEMGVYPLATYIRTVFKFHLSDHSTSCCRHILYFVPSQLGAYVYMCAHVHCICLHIQAFAHMCAPGRSAPQQSHADTLSHLTIPPHV